LFKHLYLDWNAFWHLSGSRQIGMGLGNIQISEIYAYMQMFEITDVGERRDFLRHIQVLDSTYLEFHNEKREKAQDKKAKQSKKSTPSRPKRSAKR